MKFFRIIDSFDSPARWYLGSPTGPDGSAVDPRLFTEGRRYDGGGLLYVPIKRGSEPADFTLGAFDMPIVKKEVGELIETFAPKDVQRIEVEVDDAESGYEALNVVRVIKAVDENLSEISWRIKSEAGGRHIKSYAGIGRLVLDGASIAGAHVFRLKHWELPLIISEAVKEALENNYTTGIAFKELGLNK
jgi:hypothetical protein